MTRYLIMIMFIVSTFSLLTVAQQQTTEKYDKLELTNGTIYLGTVEKVRTDIIEFREQETNLLYEFEKSQIRYIALSNGKILTFEDYVKSSNKDKTESPSPPVVIEKDSGAPVGLIILATVGVVLLVLLIIGAASQ